MTKGYSSFVKSFQGTQADFCQRFSANFMECYLWKRVHIIQSNSLISSTNKSCQQSYIWFLQRYHFCSKAMFESIFVSILPHFDLILFVSMILQDKRENVVPQTIHINIKTLSHKIRSQKLNNMLDRGFWRHCHFVVGVAGTTIEPQVRRGGGGGGGGVYGLGGHWLKCMRVFSHIDSMFGGRMAAI